MRKRQVSSSARMMRKTDCQTNCTHGCRSLTTCQTFCAGLDHLFIENELDTRTESEFQHEPVSQVVHLSIFLHFTTVVYLSAHQRPPHCPLLTLPGHHYCPWWPALQPQATAEESEASYNEWSHRHTFSCTHAHNHRHTRLRSSSCFLCRSANLLSHDALSQAILVLSDRISFSVLVSLLWRAVVWSGLPGMAATPLLSEPDNVK